MNTHTDTHPAVEGKNKRLSNASSKLLVSWLVHPFWKRKRIKVRVRAMGGMGMYNSSSKARSIKKVDPAN
jgi:hypothetical protein